jgi:hypothetical protein
MLHFTDAPSTVFGRRGGQKVQISYAAAIGPVSASWQELWVHPDDEGGGSCSRLAFFAAQKKRAEG